jgi:hypothetical protein
MTQGDNETILPVNSLLFEVLWYVLNEVDADHGNNIYTPREYSGETQEDPD